VLIDKIPAGSTRARNPSDNARKSFVPPVPDFQPELVFDERSLMRKNTAGLMYNNYLLFRVIALILLVVGIATVSFPVLIAAGIVTYGWPFLCAYLLKTGVGRKNAGEAVAESLAAVPVCGPSLGRTVPDSSM
jgi:Flp pilus assembly protein TadB